MESIYTQLVLYGSKMSVLGLGKVQNKENKNNHKKQTRKSVINERRKQT